MDMTTVLPSSGGAELQIETFSRSAKVSGHPYEGLNAPNGKTEA